MEASELARVDQNLRQLCAEHGLSWVVQAVDAAVAEGHADSATAGGSSYYQRRGGYMYGYGVRPDERSRVEPEIVERPYTDQERVLLLLDAMLAVYRDLPNLRAETVRVLTDGFRGRVPVPEQIVTALDEGDDDIVVAWQPETAAAVQNRQRVVGALAALRQAVVPL
ncbi:hypothetical protein DFJ67_3521 [Asanoa ferruginea]|uniref:Uncharacterized protein n=1 Tax=Asanoa ferruginea TaxID=53367 RepID=A0A3D9ZV24_9ACTN|nr:hypothetical protein [Asanoa ferruginea]REF97520.1 hypothetical protein DFJ67_3521 [Asanoa ferruginea]GIF48192.1 hypothetical protein Afe04nite_27310 [Asanoa ferruginea]